MGNDFMAKLERFMQVVEDQTNARIARIHPVLHSRAVEMGAPGCVSIGHNVGRVNIRVWSQDNLVQSSGMGKSVKYFVEVETGKIFGASSWKTPNKIRCYGTLDTVDDWYWGDYVATHHHGESSLVPIAERV